METSPIQKALLGKIILNHSYLSMHYERVSGILKLSIDLAKVHNNAPIKSKVTYDNIISRTYLSNCSNINHSNGKVSIIAIYYHTLDS